MNHWWYEENGVATGPVDSEELRRLLSSGKVNTDVLVWCTGFGDWWEYSLLVAEFGDNVIEWALENMTDIKDSEDGDISSPPPLPGTTIASSSSTYQADPYIPQLRQQAIPLADFVGENRYKKNLKNKLPVRFQSTIKYNYDLLVKIFTVRIRNDVSLEGKLHVKRGDFELEYTRKVKKQPCNNDRKKHASDLSNNSNDENNSVDMDLLNRAFSAIEKMELENENSIPSIMKKYNSKNTINSEQSRKNHNTEVLFMVCMCLGPFITFSIIDNMFLATVLPFLFFIVLNKSMK